MHNALLDKIVKVTKAEYDWPFHIINSLSSREAQGSIIALAWKRSRSSGMETVLALLQLSLIERN